MEGQRRRAMAARWLLLLLLGIAGRSCVLQVHGQVDNRFHKLRLRSARKRRRLRGQCDQAALHLGRRLHRCGHQLQHVIWYITPSMGRSWHNVRSFHGAAGTRSCYTLRSLVAGLKYLIRAKFLYGNYDGLDRAPVFDLHVSVNYWTTVNISNANTPVIYEIIAVVPGESVQVCLVNTGFGTPFISALDQRPSEQALPDGQRDAGAGSSHQVQLWPGRRCDPQPLPVNAVRQFYVTLNGQLWLGKGFTPQYLYTNAVFNNIPNPNDGSHQYNVSLNATANSTLPPILNALEIFSVLPTTGITTATQDVSVIAAIRGKYQVKKNWMGDPCVPKNFAWKGLGCRYAVSSPPSVTSLNLSSSGLSGNLSSSFAGLKGLQYLDLSHNNLTGSIPDTLSQLSSLTLLDLTDNQLSGSIPPGLVKRTQDGSLTLRYGNNPNLCSSGNYCQHPKKKRSSMVAIKLRSESSDQGEQEFLAEAQTLAKIHHKNLVSLIGYCKDMKYMALVYEYMSEGALDEHLRGKDNTMKTLIWRQRLRIALESAQGPRHSGDSSRLSRDKEAFSVSSETVTPRAGERGMVENRVAKWND
ncbi:hypothetical protein ZWY2020_025776 [Hordeum vulgare]|nr:hypothetical protein ZWY2020_025776 [Hordeum vulgare]